MTGRILSHALVAELMGVSPVTLRRNRAQWQRAGFPRPLNLTTRGQGKPLRYDAEAIEAWLQSQRPKAQRTMQLIDTAPPGEDAIAHQRLRDYQAQHRNAG